MAEPVVAPVVVAVWLGWLFTSLVVVDPPVPTGDVLLLVVGTACTVSAGVVELGAITAEFLSWAASTVLLTTMHERIRTMINVKKKYRFPLTGLLLYVATSLAPNMSC